MPDPALADTQTERRGSDASACLAAVVGSGVRLAATLADHLAHLLGALSAAAGTAGRIARAVRELADRARDAAPAIEEGLHVAAARAAAARDRAGELAALDDDGLGDLTELAKQQAGAWHGWREWAVGPGDGGAGAVR